MNTPEFYCYALLDPRKPGTFTYDILGESTDFKFEPFYVGKGKGDRMLQHSRASYVKRERGPKRNKIKALLDSGESVIAVKFSENLYEYAAFYMEIAAIRSIGRIDLKSGPLTNLNDGGIGQSGNVASQETREKMSKAQKGKHGYIPNAETRAKMSAAKKGKPLTEETKAKMSAVRKGRPGKPLSPETRRKISERQRGTKASEETRKKMSEASKGRSHSIESKKNLSEIQKNALKYPCEHCGKLLTKNLLAIPTHKTAFCLTDIYKSREKYRIRAAEKKALG